MKIIGLQGKGSVIFSLAVFVIIIIVVALSQKAPLELTASVSPCLGKITCFVGEVITLNVKLNPQQQEYTGRGKNITIISEAFGNQSQVVEIMTGNQSTFNVPLKTSMEKGQYTVTVESNLEDFGNFLLKIKNLFLNMIGRKYTATESLNVRYPEILTKYEDYSCKPDGFSINEIKLKLQEPTFNESLCKIRIYTNKLVTTTHPRLKEQFSDERYHYYETEMSSINRIDLAGAIQNVVFVADLAVQQTSVKIVPVCKIGQTDIEIPQDIKLSDPLNKCFVNK